MSTYSAGVGLDLTGSVFALSGQALSLHNLTGAGVFSRAADGAISLTAMGVGSAGSILTRADGDARYQAGDATLNALSGLTLAADRLIYATGTGSTATATFTVAARTLVAASTASAQRTAMGIGNVEDKSSATIRSEMLALSNTFTAKQTFSTAYRQQSFASTSAPAGNRRWGTWIDGNGWLGVSLENDDGLLGMAAMDMRSTSGVLTAVNFYAQIYMNSAPVVTTTTGYKLDTGWTARSLVARQLLSVQAAELCDTTGATAVEGYIALLLSDSRVGEVVFGPGTYKIGATSTLGGGGKRWRVMPGAIFAPIEGVKLKIQSEVEAGNYKIFDVSALGSSVVGIRSPNAYWWGLAKANFATGLATVSAAPSVNQTFIVGAQTFTIKASRSAAGEVTRSTNTATQAQNISDAINTDITSVRGAPSGSTVVLTATTDGVGGNSIVISSAVTGLAMSGATGASVNNTPSFNAQWNCMEDALTSDGIYEPPLPVGEWFCQSTVKWRGLGYLSPTFQVGGALDGGCKLVASATFSGGGALFQFGDSEVRTSDTTPPPLGLARQAGSACVVAVDLVNSVSFFARRWSGLYINGFNLGSDSFPTCVRIRGFTTLWYFENYGLYAKGVPNAVIWDFESSTNTPVGDFGFGKGQSVVSPKNGSVHFKLVTNGWSVNGINIMPGYHMYGGRAFFCNWLTAHNIGDIFISAGSQMDSMGAGLIYAHPSQGQLFNLQMSNVYITQADGADDTSVNAIDIVGTGSAIVHTLDFSGCQIVGFGGRAALFSNIQGLVCSNNRLREIGGGEFADTAIYIDNCTGVAAIGNVYTNPYNPNPVIAGRRPLSLVRLQNNCSYATVCSNSGNGIAVVISKDDGAAAITTGTKVVANNI